MDNLEQKIEKYYNNLMDDLFFFSKDIMHNLREFDLDYITSHNHLNNLLETMKELKKRQIYPKFCLDNMAKLITYLSENIKENDEFHECKMVLINQIAQIYLKIRNNESSDIYNLEYEKKYSDRYLINEPIFIRKDLMEDSIKYDYLVISSFFEPSELFYETSKNRFSSELYLLGIKKIMFDNPIFFENREIKKRTLYILNSNLEEAKKNNKDTSEYEKIIKKLNQTLINSSYCNSNLIYTYNTSLIKIMAIKEIDKPDLINEDLLSVAYDLTKKDYVYDESMREVILNIMNENLNYYRVLFKEDKDKLKIFLSIYNQYLGNINSNKNTSKPNLYTLELENIFNYLEVIIYAIGIGKKLTNEDIRKSIYTDYHLIKSLISSEEKFEEFKNRYIESDLTLLSIKKLLNLDPILFDNNIINRRIKELVLNHTNNKESKKLLKLIEKNNY